MVEKSPKSRILPEKFFKSLLVGDKVISSNLSLALGAFGVEIALLIFSREIMHPCKNEDSLKRDHQRIEHSKNYLKAEYFKS